MRVYTEGLEEEMTQMSNGYSEQPTAQVSSALPASDLDRLAGLGFQVRTATAAG